jgi:hypothetical protein
MAKTWFPHEDGLAEGEESKPLFGPRFGWFWYNEEAIFSFSKDDFDRQAADFHRAGVNHVITFSSTHFRWSHRRDWALLTETLARVVRACHRHGIHVTMRA